MCTNTRYGGIKISPSDTYIVTKGMRKVFALISEANGEAVIQRMI